MQETQKDCEEMTQKYITDNSLKINDSEHRKFNKTQRLFWEENLYTAVANCDHCLVNKQQPLTTLTTKS